MPSGFSSLFRIPIARQNTTTGLNPVLDETRGGKSCGGDGIWPNGRKMLPQGETERAVNDRGRRFNRSHIQAQ